MKPGNLHHHIPGAHSQSGAALAISLIMLLLLTIIGVTAMQSTTLQERMAGNSRERSIAFQVAETALRDGEMALEASILGTFVSTSSSSTNGLYRENASADEAWYLSKTSVPASSAAGTFDDSSFVIEQLSAVPGSGGSLEAGVPGLAQYYRVTARGQGTAGTAVILLQSTFKR